MGGECAKALSRPSCCENEVRATRTSRTVTRAPRHARPRPIRRRMARQSRLARPSSVEAQLSTRPSHHRSPGAVRFPAPAREPYRCCASCGSSSASRAPAASERSERATRSRSGRKTISSSSSAAAAAAAAAADGSSAAGRRAGSVVRAWRVRRDRSTRRERRERRERRSALDSVGIGLGSRGTSAAVRSLRLDDGGASRALSTSTSSAR